jgi:hypothetical protein
MALHAVEACIGLLEDEGHVAAGTAKFLVKIRWSDGRAAQEYSMQAARQTLAPQPTPELVDAMTGSSADTHVFIYATDGSVKVSAQSPDKGLAQRLVDVAQATFERPGPDPPLQVAQQSRMEQAPVSGWRRALEWMNKNQGLLTGITVLLTIVAIVVAVLIA